MNLKPRKSKLSPIAQHIEFLPNSITPESKIEVIRVKEMLRTGDGPDC